MSWKHKHQQKLDISQTKFGFSRHFSARLSVIVCMCLFVFSFLTLFSHYAIQLPSAEQVYWCIKLKCTYTTDEVANDPVLFLLFWAFFLSLVWLGCVLVDVVFTILAVVRGQFDCLAIYIICVFFVTNQFRRRERRRRRKGICFVSISRPANGDIPKVNQQWIWNRISDWIEIIYLVCVERWWWCECILIFENSIPFHLKWSNPCSLSRFSVGCVGASHSSHEHQQNTLSLWIQMEL